MLPEQEERAPALPWEARRLPGRRQARDPGAGGGAPSAASKKPGSRASGSIASATPVPARRPGPAASGWRARHDAELVEHVWGTTCESSGIVVEPLHGIDDLARRDSGPRRAALGILVDHLVQGSKESRLAATVRDQRAGDRASVRGRVGRDPAQGARARPSGPTCHRGAMEGRDVRRPGRAVRGFWPKLRNRVTTYADLRPELVGAVERLIDFVPRRPEPGPGPGTGSGGRIRRRSGCRRGPGASIRSTSTSSPARRGTCRARLAHRPAQASGSSAMGQSCSNQARSSPSATPRPGSPRGSAAPQPADPQRHGGTTRRRRARRRGGHLVLGRVASDPLLSASSPRLPPHGVEHFHIVGVPIGNSSPATGVSRR